MNIIGGPSLSRPVHAGHGERSGGALLVGDGGGKCMGKSPTPMKLFELRPQRGALQLCFTRLTRFGIPGDFILHVSTLLEPPTKSMLLHSLPHGTTKERARGWARPGQHRSTSMTPKRRSTETPKPRSFLTEPDRTPSKKRAHGTPHAPFCWSSEFTCSLVSASRHSPPQQTGRQQRAMKKSALR